MNNGKAVGSDLLHGIMENAGLNTPVERQKWEDLEDLFNDIGGGIIRIGQEINEALAIVNPNIHHLEAGGREELTVTVNGLNSDLKSFASDLAKIHKMHQGRTGIVEADDYALCLEVFNSYVILQDRFKSLTFNPVVTITEKMISVRGKLEQEQLADPKVISDVEVKEVKVNE